MTDREGLQLMLERELGNRHVYFQPPPSIMMNYPAIVYELNDIEKTYASNDIYQEKRSYTVTLIDEDPDSPIVEKLLRLPYCRFTRSFKSDNLNHFSFRIYY